MTFTTLISVGVLAVATGSVMAQPPKAQATAPAPKLRSLTGEDPLPTEEEIKAFVQTYKESESSKDSLSLRVNFFVPKMQPAQRKKYEQNKKVPYQIYVDLIKTKDVNGKQMSTRETNGKCNVAVLDETGKIVKQSATSLIKLCAS